PYGRSTHTRPPSTVAGYDRTGVLAGGPTTSPVVTSNLEPCSGHSTTKSSSSPWHSGPPTCVHRLSRQYTLLPILNRATARCPRVAHVGSPSRSSLSGPASIRMRPSLLTRPSDRKSVV